jgi:hypothetical protein
MIESCVFLRHQVTQNENKIASTPTAATANNFIDLTRIRLQAAI